MGAVCARPDLKPPGHNPHILLPQITPKETVRMNRSTRLFRFAGACMSMFAPAIVLADVPPAEIGRTLVSLTLWSPACS